MIEKNSQSLANQYYRLTEETYRRLDPCGTDFMNLGIWPAPSIASAQTNIYLELIALTKNVTATNAISNVVELGCGWGGGMAVLKDAFPNSEIIGVNSSASQTNYCNNKYSVNKKIRFENCFYESFQMKSRLSESLVFAIESLLHCGDRSSVFKMLEDNSFQYVALAEILLIDEDARSNKLFNPALSFAAGFEDYENLFRTHNFDLLVTKDVSSEVFAPWVDALKTLTPSLTGAHKRIKDQFIQSYTTLSDLCDAGRARYVFYVAKRKGKS